MKNTLVKGLRHFSRIPFDAAVQLEVGGRALDVHLIDIALKGALVATAVPQALALHEKCRLILPLADGGETITMVGEVAHLEDDHVGVACREIDVASLTRLRRLLELNTGDADLMNRELSLLFKLT